MDGILSFLGGDWMAILCTVLSFVIGYIMKNAKLAKIVAVFGIYWKRAGRLMSETNDLLLALSSLHAEATEATKDGKIDPEEMERIIVRAEALMKEAEDIKDLFTITN